MAFVDHRPIRRKKRGCHKLTSLTGISRFILRFFNSGSLFFPAYNLIFAPSLLCDCYCLFIWYWVMMVSKICNFFFSGFWVMLAILWYPFARFCSGCNFLCFWDVGSVHVAPNWPKGDSLLRKHGLDLDHMIKNPSKFHNFPDEVLWYIINQDECLFEWCLDLIFDANHCWACFVVLACQCQVLHLFLCFVLGLCIWCMSMSELVGDTLWPWPTLCWLL